jgi:hypothetical protein
MKLETIKKRLNPKRPMVSITLRMPADVVADLKQIAPAKGMTGYQALIRAYVGQSLREDLEKFDDAPIQRFITKLQAKGVSKKLIADAMR